MTRDEWIAGSRPSLGVEPPDAATVETLLALAGTAAHASERTAAPIACYLVGLGGVARPRRPPPGGRGIGDRDLASLTLAIATSTGPDGHRKASRDRRHHRAVALAPGDARLGEAGATPAGGHVPRRGGGRRRVAAAAEQAAALGHGLGQGRIGGGLVPPGPSPAGRRPSPRPGGARRAPSRAPPEAASAWAGMSSALATTPPAAPAPTGRRRAAAGHRLGQPVQGGGRDHGVEPAVGDRHRGSAHPGSARSARTTARSSAPTLARDGQQGGVDVDRHLPGVRQPGQHPAADRPGPAGQVEHRRGRAGDRLDDVDQRPSRPRGRGNPPAGGPRIAASPQPSRLRR